MRFPFLKVTFSILGLLSLTISTHGFCEAVPSSSVQAPFALVCEAVSDFHVRIRLSNVGATDVRVLPSGIPQDGKLRNALFRVQDDKGKEARYLGEFVDRTSPTESDYLLLERGKSLEAFVDLSKFYEIDSSGTYTVDADLVVIFYPSDHFDVTRTPQYFHLKSNALRMPERPNEKRSR